jgi:hypothetical protein
MDLQRLLFYSVRVRVFSDKSYLQTAVDGNVETEFLQALEMSLASGALMPNLTRLSWNPTDESSLPLVRILLGPRIRQIELTLGATASDLSFLPYLKSTCPLVSLLHLRLKLTPFTLPTFTLPTISHVICGWTYLQDLRIPSLDKQGFIHIASLPCLKTLDLTYADEDPVPLHLPDFISGPAFPALEDLSVACRTARFCQGILEIISSRQVETVGIYTMFAHWKASAWEALHTTIRDRLDHNALKHIYVMEHRRSQTPLVDVAPYTLTSVTLRPLMVFKNLLDIKYELSPEISVDDAFLEELALAWPHLTSLEFGTETFTNRTPQATLRCLIAFARHCPKLESLGVRMNVSEFNVPQFSHSYGNRIAHDLNALYVGTSPIGEPAPVAAFLSNIFKDMEYLFTYSGSEDNRHGEGWSRVFDMLPIFCSVRQQEEEYWTLGTAEGEENED